MITYLYISETLGKYIFCINTNEGCGVLQHYMTTSSSIINRFYAVCLLLNRIVMIIVVENMLYGNIIK